MKYLPTFMGGHEVKVFPVFGLSAFGDFWCRSCGSAMAQKTPGAMLEEGPFPHDEASRPGEHGEKLQSIRIDAAG